MTCGYIVLKEDFAGLIAKNLLTTTSFVYDGAYDYILSVILSGKPIIFNAEITVPVSDHSVTIYVHDIISSGVSNDGVSITVWFQGTGYDVSVLKRAKNDVKITAIRG